MTDISKVLSDARNDSDMDPIHRALADALTASLASNDVYRNNSSNVFKQLELARECKIELSGCKRELKAIQLQHSELIQSSNKLQKNLQLQVETAKENVDNLTVQLETKEHLVQSLKQEIAALRSNKGSSLSNDKEKERLSAEIMDCKSENENLNSQIASLKKSNESLHIEYQELALNLHSKTEYLKVLLQQVNLDINTSTDMMILKEQAEIAFAQLKSMEILNSSILSQLLYSPDTLAIDITTIKKTAMETGKRVALLEQQCENAKKSVVDLIAKYSESVSSNSSVDIVKSYELKLQQAADYIQLQSDQLRVAEAKIQSLENNLVITNDSGEIALELDEAKELIKEYEVKLLVSSSSIRK